MSALQPTAPHIWRTEVTQARTDYLDALRAGGKVFRSNRREVGHPIRRGPWAPFSSAPPISDEVRSACIWKPVSAMTLLSNNVPRHGTHLCRSLEFTTKIAHAVSYPADVAECLLVPVDPVHICLPRLIASLGGTEAELRVDCCWPAALAHIVNEQVVIVPDARF